MSLLSTEGGLIPHRLALSSLEAGCLTSRMRKVDLRCQTMSHEAAATHGVAIDPDESPE
jgi:hypothetical protein